MKDLEKALLGLISQQKFFSNLSLAFASAKTIEKTPVKIGKITQVTKNKDATSNNNEEDLKMISIHPGFVEDLNPFKNIGCVIEELETKDDNT